MKQQADADKKEVDQDHQGHMMMPQRNSLIWSAIAVFIGLILALLPLPYALLFLVIGILGTAALVDVRIALIITLIVAPLKALLETEIPTLARLPLDVGQLLLLLTVVIWLGHTVAQRRSLFVWTPLYIPLLIFILLVLPSLWNTLSLESSIKELAKWIEMLIMIAVILSVTEDNNTQWLVAAVIAAACTQAVIGIYQFFGGSGTASFWILDYEHFRAFGTFGNPDPFGGFMSLGLCLAIGALLYCLERLRNQSRADPVRFVSISSFIISIVAVALLSLGLLFSWSRGAWVGFGIALVVMLFSFPHRRWFGVALLITIIICVALALTLHLVPAPIVARLNDFTRQFTGYDVQGVLVTDSNYALIERLAHWQSAIRMAADHPWFGVGLGSYATAYPRYALVNWPLALGHAHNYYLNVLAETGIVGLTGYMIVIGGSFWLIGKTYFDSVTGRAIIVGILGAWIGLAVHNAFDMLYVNNLYIHIGVLLGLIARYRQAAPSR